MMINTDSTGKLNLLYQLGQQLNSSLDFEFVLNSAMAQVVDLMNAERGFILLKQGETLQCHVAHGIPAQDVKGGADYSRSIIETVLVSEQPVRLMDALTDERILPKASIRAMGVRSVICAPLKVKDRVIGIIYLDTTRAQDVFREQDLAVLVAFANNASVAIENARLYKELSDHAEKRVALERQILEQEKRTALLEMSQAMREEFAHYLVHDMRNPLAVIIGNLSLLKPAIEELLGTSEFEAFSDTEKSAAMLVEMVNSILEIYKLEAGRVQLDLVEIELHGLLEELARTNRGTVCRDVALTANTDGSSLVVMADEGMIRRVIANLISNAAHFTVRGSIVLSAEATADGALITVSDTGPGIPAEYHATIFEKFGSVKARAGGLKGFFGLGLRFCQLAVEAHRGRIWVDSEVGRGSTFSVLLPLSQ